MGSNWAGPGFSLGVAMQFHGSLARESYAVQSRRWPTNGRHILAQFDEQHIVVYQAYRPSIALEAVANHRFGSRLSLNRMSWIKPGFLWMMYRSGWASKVDQEVILALWLPRMAFDALLALAVPSQFDVQAYPDESSWRQAVPESQVRLQWDPDHDPDGGPLHRRVVQLGLRGEVLRQYAREWLVDVQDLSDFAREQREVVRARRDDLVVPREDVYPVADPAVARRIGIDSC